MSKHISNSDTFLTVKPLPIIFASSECVKEHLTKCSCLPTGDELFVEVQEKALGV